MFLCRNRLERQLRERFRYADDGFELSNGNGDGGALICVNLNLMDFLADADKVTAQLLRSVGGETRGTAGFAVRDVALHSLDTEFARIVVVIDLRPAHVQGHDVAGDSLVAAGVVGILDDKNHIETGEDGGLKVNIFAGGFHVVVAAKNGIGRGKDGGAGI